jgi:hypothetical protein
MKCLLTILVFSYSVCMAQNNISEPENSKDTLLKHRVLIFTTIGVGLPSGNYGKPNTDYSLISKADPPYGYSNVGGHLDATGVYLISGKFGVAINLGTYYNSVDNVNYGSSPINSMYNCFGGIYVNPIIKPGCSFYFLATVGLITANIYNGQNNFFMPGPPYGVFGLEIPGFGYGLGGYFAACLSNKIGKRLSIDCSLGYLVSSVGFHNDILTTYYQGIPIPNTTETYNTTTVQKYSLFSEMNVLSLNVGIKIQL